MKHAAILALAVLFLAFGARAASAKPKVAILGIEVTGAIDQAATGVAHDLTEGLRTKAKQGNGPFQLAPNAERELIDEKVLKNCDSEGPLCMSDIGKDINTDVLIYGQLAKSGDGYSAKIFVLDVKKKSKEKELTVRIPGGASSDVVRNLAKKAYSDLVGGGAPPVEQPGTLMIEANVDAGTVFVDDEQKETLQGGKARLQLAEGRYRVAIESPGRRRKEIAVTITGGESTTESFQLAEKGEGGGKPASFWKPAFGVTAALTLVLAGVSTFEYLRQGSEIDKVVNATTNDGKTLTEAACPSDIIGGTGEDTTHFDNACSAHTIHLWTAVGAVVFGVAAVGSGYMAFVRKPAESATKTSARKPLLDRIVIAPVLSPGTQGALIDLRW
jgi:hypothetical protein